MFFKAKSNDLQIWIEGCRRNDRRSQKALYYHYFDSLCRIVGKYTQDEQLTTEIVNDAMMKVYKNIDRYEEKGSFEAWLKRIAYTTVVDYFRAEHRKIKFLLPEDMNETPGAESKSEDELTLDDIMMCIKRLPETPAQVFILFVLEGYSHKEISQMLNIAENTSKWHLMNAKKELRLLINNNFTNLIG